MNFQDGIEPVQSALGEKLYKRRDIAPSIGHFVNFDVGSPVSHALERRGLFGGRSDQQNRSLRQQLESLDDLAKKLGIIDMRDDGCTYPVWRDQVSHAPRTQSH